MWTYERKLEYPVNIKTTSADMALAIMSQYGGPNGEAGAYMRYFSQMFAMKNRKVAGVLLDIATEEMAHMEIVCAIVHQLTRNLKPEQIEGTPFQEYYVDHTTGIYPQSGVPFTALTFQSVGDPITDLHEDMAADATTAKEQPAFLKARKPLVLLDFRHFRVFRKNGIPATI